MCRIRPCEKAAPCGAALCLYRLDVRFSADGRSRVFCRDMPCFFGRIDDAVRHGGKEGDAETLYTVARAIFRPAFLFVLQGEPAVFGSRRFRCVRNQPGESAGMGSFGAETGEKFREAVLFVFGPVVVRGRRTVRSLRRIVVPAIRGCFSDGAGPVGAGRYAEYAERKRPNTRLLRFFSSAGGVRSAFAASVRRGANPFGRSRGSRSAWQWPTGRRPDRCVRPKRGLPWPVRPVRPAACSWR